MNTYDYDRQRWVEGNEAITLRIRQIKIEIKLLNGPRGEEYARWRGIPRQQTIHSLNDQLQQLTGEQ